MELAPWYTSLKGEKEGGREGREREKERVREGGRREREGRGRISTTTGTKLQEKYPNHWYVQLANSRLTYFSLCSAEVNPRARSWMDKQE